MPRAVLLLPLVVALMTLPAWPQEARTEPAKTTVPRARAITTGPKFHWFGYYDKHQFDPTGRYVLGMETDFENRSPRPDDVIRIGMVDLEDGDRWVPLGESRAWCWQQGCMLQWLPGSSSEIIWNDREGDRFVSRVLDVKTRKSRTLPLPIYTITSDGRLGFSPDFRRLNDCRPGYGYAGLPDPNRGVRAPADVGIWRMDLRTGQHKLIVSLAEIARIPWPHGDLAQATHWFNHLLVNPDDTRLEFLHRWRLPGQKSFTTRMLTANLDGKDIRVVDDDGGTSHFIWRDPQHILAWASQRGRGDRFYLFEDHERTGASAGPAVVGQEVMPQNGHCSYLPLAGREWILNDTYPDRQRKMHLYLFHVPTGRRVPLGDFHLPPAYQGEWRCDLHPRTSRDARKVVIDSAHAGNGRQMYLIDIAGIVRPQ